MGIPSHYSQELPRRCLQLIDALMPNVEQVHASGEAHLGPLTTTFLLAMSTPMVVLPIERVERYRGKSEGYMDDRPIDVSLAGEIDARLGSSALRHSPFFEEGHWRFASIPYQGQNLARHFPWELSDELAAPAALAAAEQMPASEWASCLRNALAHGGIAYLDAEGRQAYGQSAKMLAFVSAKYVDRGQPPERLKVLRITEQGYLSFLRRWVDWLQSSGLQQALAA